MRVGGEGGKVGGVANERKRNGQAEKEDEPIGSRAEDGVTEQI